MSTKKSLNAINKKKVILLIILKGTACRQVVGQAIKNIL